MTANVGTTRLRRVESAATGRLSARIDRHFAVLLVLPATLLILALSIYPLIYSVWVAFVNYDFQVPGHAFVGLQNFTDVVSDPIAAAALKNTLVFAIADVVIEFGLGLVLALAMMKPFRGRAAIMPVLLVPLFVSPVIVGQFWSLLLQRPFGPVDYLLGVVAGHPVTISWLTEMPWNYIAIVLADVWQWTPFMFVILLAGLASIPTEMYQAAELDGASRWQSFRYVTLPLLMPAILLAVTFRFLDATKIFDVIFVMTGGGPGSSTYTASYYLYQIGFQQFHLSAATAGSWIFLGLTALAVNVLVRRLVRPELNDMSLPAATMGSVRRPWGIDALRFVYIGAVLVFILVPLYWVVVTSIKPVDDYQAIPPVWFPAHPTLVHYTAALFSYRGLQGLINSAIIASVTTACSAVLGTMMAYSLARFNTGGKHLAFWVLSQRFLPPVAIVLPVFLLYRNVGLNDTRTGIILFYTMASLPLSVWMMYTYFRQLPKEMEEAALVDGASRWRAFWMVGVPLAMPGIAAAAVFTFIFCWTEFFFALNLTSRNAFTLPTVFRAFLGFQAAQYGEASALAVVSLVPSIVLGMLVQKHLVRGLTLGALNG